MLNIKKFTIKNCQSHVILQKEMVSRHCQETVSDKTAFLKFVSNDNFFDVYVALSAPYKNGATIPKIDLGRFFCNLIV